jgi:hypothetical protein
MENTLAVQEKRNTAVKTYNPLSMFFDIEQFEFQQRVAQMFAQSTMIPKDYMGNVSNCMIALNLAYRWNADPLLVMQNIYIVHNRPGLSGQMAIARINQSGRFEGSLKFDHINEGNRKTGKDAWECVAYAKEKRTGDTLKISVDWNTVVEEGWDKDKKSKSGYVQKSKWNSMPKQMFHYRSAAWFARAYCPEVLMGMQTAEELEDVEAIEMAQNTTGAYEVKNKSEQKVVELKNRLEEAKKVEKPKPTPVEPKGIADEILEYVKEARVYYTDITEKCIQDAIKQAGVEDVTKMSLEDGEKLKKKHHGRDNGV